MKTNISPYKLSIIIPTYNRCQLLPRSIESILTQNTLSTEIIVIDDGSIDETSKVIERYQCPLLRYIKNDTNLGVSSSRNKAASLAQGDYLLFLDDDDELFPNAVSETLKHLHHFSPALDFAWQSKRIRYIKNYGYIDEDRIWQQDSMTTPMDLDFLNLWSNPGLIIAKEVLLDIGGYDETMSMAEDLDLVVRLLQQKKRYAAIPRILMQVNVDDRLPSLSRHQEAAKEAWHLEHYREKNKTFFESHPNLYRRLNYSLMAAYYRSNQRKKAHSTFRSALNHQFFDFKLWGRWFEFELLQRFKRGKN